ncbi:MAG: hypothetical protein IPO15_14800 [Anaerolineae bacterium]|uniref:hypothetical protein n=1 Tax=Candidatus Amarolinea dominans TaxID=3140696 RepID=UPI0031367938|nr:hypothetical protein [Anaerolineae bacterium]
MEQQQRRVYVGAVSEDDDAGRSDAAVCAAPDFQNLSFDDSDLGRRYRLTPDDGRHPAAAAWTRRAPDPAALRHPVHLLTLDLQHPVAVPLRNLNVLVADVGAQVTSPDLQEGPARQVEQATYFSFTAAEVPARQDD